MNRMPLAVLTGVLIGGALACGPKTPQQMRRQACESPELYSKVAILPSGHNPTRPFRIVGAVDALYSVDAAGRMRTLQVKACALGADAILDIKESTRVTSANATITGDYVSIQENQHTTASAMAIAFTDEPAELSDTPETGDAADLSL